MLVFRHFLKLPPVIIIQFHLQNNNTLFYNEITCVRIVLFYLRLAFRRSR